MAPEAALSDSAVAAVAADALVRPALRDDDRQFVEVARRQLTTKLNAALLFGYVSDDAAALVVELASRARADSSDVHTRAIGGLDDVRQFGRQGSLDVS